MLIEVRSAGQGLLLSLRNTLESLPTFLGQLSARVMES